MQERRGTSASGAPSGAARARRLQARVAISSSAQKLSHLAVHARITLCPYGSHLAYAYNMHVLPVLFPSRRTRVVRAH